MINVWRISAKHALPRLKLQTCRGPTSQRLQQCNQHNNSRPSAIYNAENHQHILLIDDLISWARHMISWPARTVRPAAGIILCTIFVAVCLVLNKSGAGGEQNSFRKDFWSTDQFASNQTIISAWVFSQLGDVPRRLKLGQTSEL